jgi:hypothetical protein
MGKIITYHKSGRNSTLLIKIYHIINVGIRPVPASRTANSDWTFINKLSIQRLIMTIYQPVWGIRIRMFWVSRIRIR